MATKPDAFPPLEAGALLVSVTVAGLALGALCGWPFAAAGDGLVAGAIVGLPAGVFAVYHRYRRFFS